MLGQSLAFGLHHAFMQSRTTGQQKHGKAVHCQTYAPAHGREHGPVAAAGDRQGDQQQIDQKVDAGVDLPAQLGTGTLARQAFDGVVGRVFAVHGEISSGPCQAPQTQRTRHKQAAEHAVQG